MGSGLRFKSFTVCLNKETTLLSHVGPNKTPSVLKKHQELLMSKRIIYSIPLAGFALTSFGCGEEPPPVIVDELVNTFTVDTAAGLVLPQVIPGIDINGDATLYCDYVISADDVTIAADLTASETIRVTLDNCLLNGVADPASEVELYAYTYTVAAVVVTLNAAYTITLTDAAGVTAFILDCTLAAGALDCIDDSGDAWAFTAQ
jgi:hypothetical protein